VSGDLAAQADAAAARIRTALLATP
jgi:hypothetical protein